jgi:hypothetical protein
MCSTRASDPPTPKGFVSFLTRFCFIIKDKARGKGQGSTKLFPIEHMIDRICVLVKKDSNAKKEIY